MKVACDIDEVIVGFVEKCMEFVESQGVKRVCYEDIYSYELWKVLEIEKDFFIELLDKGNIEGYFEDLLFIDGAKDGVCFLRDNYDIFFVTARPKRTIKSTRDFVFEEFNILGNKVFFSGDVLREGKSKCEICGELGIDLIIEDNGFDSLRYAKNGVKVLLLDKPWNRGVEHENIYRCRDWREIVEKIKEMDNE